jgi:hypothetical protein
VWRYTAATPLIGAGRCNSSFHGQLRITSTYIGGVRNICCPSLNQLRIWLFAVACFSNAAVMYEVVSYFAHLSEEREDVVSVTSVPYLCKFESVVVVPLGEDETDPPSSLDALGLCPTRW